MNENEIEKKAIHALDDSLDEISPEVRQGLYEARQKALSTKSKPWFQQPAVGWAVAAGVSGLLFVNYFPQQQEGISEANASLASDVDIEDLMFLSSLDETDLDIMQDLEFSYWLSEQLNDEEESETLPSDDMRNG